MDFSLYLHWPYCVSKCPYCDFNSYVGKQEPTEVWQAAYIKSLNQWKERWPHYTHVKSIFWGGGTPSLMEPKLVEAVLNHVKSSWILKDSCEVTLETNPQSFEIEKFQAMASAGINRVSIGVQSFDNQNLHFLKRAHSSDDAKRAIDGAMKHFPKVSIDLISTLPDQTVQNWGQDLETGLSFGTDHISCYQLTIEQGTAFAQQFERGDWALPDEEIILAIDDKTKEMCLAKGLLDYEISNYAKPGFECQHNLTYWRYEDYAGVGPGGHGRLSDIQKKRYATQHAKTPHAWLEKVLTHQEEDVFPISSKEAFDERILMGLRLREGIVIDTHNLNQQRLQIAIDENWIERKEETIRATTQGRMRLNALLAWLTESA